MSEKQPAGHKTQLQTFVEEEVGKVKGIAVPVHASLLERATVRKAKCTKLHPNPEDEFCIPEIGPNAGIVSHYVQEFARLNDDPDYAMTRPPCNDPLYVQKIRPNGYMIMNGHHRWAAATRMGIERLPVRIVNLTQVSDIRKRLEQSNHDKRVTLDLEEVVYASGEGASVEKALPFPLNRFYGTRLRLGIPALFHFFDQKGYDVWLYSSGYESVDYVRELLRLHHTQATGLITTPARKMARDHRVKEPLEALMARKYSRTIHVDLESLLCVDSGSKDFCEYPLKGDATWSAKVMEAMEDVIKNA